MSTSHQKQQMIARQQNQDAQNNNNNNQKKNNNNSNRRDEKDADAFVPISKDIKRDIQTSLHLPIDDTAFPYHRFFARKVLAREPKIYFVSQDAPGIIESIASSGSGKNASKVVSVGVRVIDSASRFSFRASRLSLEGANVMAQLLPSCFIHETDAETVLKQVAESEKKDETNTKTNNNNNKNAFATQIPFKLPSGFRSVANDFIREQHAARLAKDQEERKDQAQSSSSFHPPLPANPQPLRQVLVSIKLGPNVPSNAHSASVVTVPCELDPTSHAATLHIQRTTLNLLRYSLEGGFTNVLLDEKEETEDRKQRRLNGAAGGVGGGAGDGDDDDDENDDEEQGDEDDENCCGPEKPPTSE